MEFFRNVPATRGEIMKITTTACPSTRKATTRTATTALQTRTRALKHLLAIPAFAVATVTPSFAVAQGDSSGFSLEEVTVTARRVQENQQDVPVSVSVATAVDLERMGITRTTELTNIVPNLQFATYGTLTGNNSAAQVFIRGIGQTDATAGVDPGVGVYVDDVYMGRAVGAAMDFRDIASTQVLRGPQGTLFGRNTIGGAVLVTTNKPGAGNSIRLGAGEDSLFEGFVAADLVDEDQYGVRIAFGGRVRDGYVNRVSDGKDFGDDEMYTGQLTVEFRPTDNLELIFRGDYTDEDENGSPFVFLEINETSAFPMIQSAAAGCPGSSFPPPVPVPDVDDPRCANDNQALGDFTNGGTSVAYSTLENMGLSASAEWDVSDRLSIVSITSYRELDWTGARDADNTPLLILATTADSENEQFSQEIRAHFTLDRFNGVIGAYYFDEDTTDKFRATLGTPGTSYDANEVFLDSEALALFTEWSYQVSDVLSVSAGLRYTSEDKDLKGTWFNVAGADTPLPPAPTTLCPLVGVPTAGCLFVAPGTHSEDFDKVTGSANVSYRATEGLMVYGVYSQGFKSGGFNRRYNSLLQADGSPLSYEDETAESVELGFKADPSNHVRLNGAVFWNSYEDIQLSYRVGPAPLLFNAGEATIKGAELELYYIPSERFIVDASVGILDAELDDVSTVPDLGPQTPSATTEEGNQLPRAPDSEFHLGASYIFDIGSQFELTPRFDLTYRDSIFFDAANAIGESSTTLVNGSLTLASIDKAWRLTLRGDNLTDEKYLLAGTTSASTATGYSEGIYARPRNFSLVFTKDF